MSCPHATAGRCALAELLARQEIGKELECRPTEVRCSLCQRAGAASVDKPGAAVLGMVTAQAATDERWKAFVELHTTGKVRGVGDRLAKGLAKVGITKQRASKVSKALGGSGCGCSKRQNALNKILPY